MNRKFFVLIAIAVLGLTGCQKDDEYSGNGIRFSVSTGTEGTRTSYSGDITTHGGSKYERIDWTVNDLIRIYCPEASEPAATHYQDYKVTSFSTASNGNSRGKIALADANAAPLEWNDNEATPHDFFAVYPSPATTGTASGFGMSDAEVTLAFPEVQTPASVTGSASAGYTAAPDTRYLYMVAKTLDITKATASGREVFLEFLPMVTAIEFTITNKYTDQSDMNVVDVFLQTSSSTVKLHGTTTASLATAWSGTVPAFPVPTDGGTTVRIPLGTTAAPLTVGYNKTVKFTFLLPPFAATNLTFGITTTTGGTRTSALSYSNGTPITFGARQKHFVQGLFVPEHATWIVPEGINSTGQQTEQLVFNSSWQNL